MQIVDELIGFKTDKLGLKVASDYRRDGHNWWVSLTLPQDGAATSDLAAAHKEIGAKGAKVSDVKDDLYGPGSGVKWLNLEDPDANQVFLVQA